MNTSTTVSSALSEVDIQSFLLDFSFTSDFSFALWRLPNNSSRHLILSRQNDLLKKGSPLEELPTGFIFSPFDRNKDSVFLKAEFAFSFDENLLRTPESPLEINSSAWLDEELKKRIKTGIRLKQFPKISPSEKSKTDFMDLVAQGIGQVESGSLEKIVLSRVKKVAVSDNIDIISIFQKLCKEHPNALVSVVNTPEHGIWIGATPETLVSVEDKTIFRTVALAGTKSYTEGLNLKNVAWTQKEIEEQALVERYIISCFKKIRLREYDEHGPKTSVAGDLMHLRSDFVVDMKATNFPQLGSVMLQLLHPTSAVCGMPLDVALDFLKNHEGYDREFYSGYLGPVNFNRNINIFVNLRCMQLFENNALLYAGAGITIDSVPEQEWEETEIKFNTMLRALVNA
jgi:isochorismate synthase